MASTALTTTAADSRTIDEDSMDQPLPKKAGAANEYLETAKEKIRDMPKSSRLALLVGIPLIVAFLIISLIYATNKEYKVLFNGISSEDGGKIVEILRQMNIPYEYSNGGTTILVPEKSVYDTRLALANRGLPKPTVQGYEAMENQRLGITQFQEQVNYQRAVEGELTKSIQSLAAVNSARVHLAIPKPSIFIREEQEPSASVVLDILGGKSLSKSQIDGIVYLVSSSVPGLSAENVSIVDQYGKLLTSSQALEDGVSATELAHQRQIERDLRSRILELLAPVYGLDNLQATVTAKVNYNREEKTSEYFAPNTTGESAIRSQQTEEDINGGNINPFGVPGTLTNTPPGAANAEIGANPQNLQANQNANAQQSASKNATINYELSRDVTHVKSQIGTIQRVSAGVVVNYKTISDKKGEVRAVPLTPEEILQVENLVKQAIGFEQVRGDSVTVSNQEFTPLDANLAAEEAVPAWMEAGKSIAIPLAVALVASVFIFALVRARMNKAAQDDGPELIPMSDSDLEQTNMLNALENMSTPDDNLIAGILPNGDKSPDEMIAEMRKVAKEQPQMIASIMKQWVSGEPAA